MKVREAAQLTIGTIAFLAIIAIGIIVQAAFIKLYPKGDFYE